MGWENIKERYAIQHLIQVTDAGICIGSGYIHNLIVIAPNGTLIKRYDGAGGNAQLQRYQLEFDANPAALSQAALSPDVFSVSIPVYTYQGASILEKFCEVPGYPNVTHDGLLMYENMYSVDRDKVVKWAQDNAKARLKLLRDELVRLEIRTRSVKDEIACALHQCSLLGCEAEHVS